MTNSIICLGGPIHGKTVGDTGQLLHEVAVLKKPEITAYDTIIQLDPYTMMPVWDSFRKEVYHRKTFRFQTYAGDKGGFPEIANIIREWKCTMWTDYYKDPYERIPTSPVKYAVYTGDALVHSSLYHLSNPNDLIPILEYYHNEQNRK